MTDHDEITDVAIADVSSGLVQHDPTASFAHTEKLVRYMSSKCTGPQFISNIQGRKYPKVEWWTTIGVAIGLSPVEISSKRIDFDGGYKYEAVVEVRRGDQVVSRASALCSTEERSWGQRDEYAVKSMASTRATGKAYRIGLSALAVMAGLEPTPADEIPPQGFQDERRATAPASEYGTCPIHNVEWFKRGKMRGPAHPIDGGGWCDKDKVEDGVDTEGSNLAAMRRRAEEVVARLIGGEADRGKDRAEYIITVLGRQVNHPNELTYDDWQKIMDMAAGDLEARQAPVDDSYYPDDPQEELFS